MSNTTWPAQLGVQPNPRSTIQLTKPQHHTTLYQVRHILRVALACHASDRYPFVGAHMPQSP